MSTLDYLIIALIVLQVADVVTTIDVMRHGGKEGNAFLAKLMSKFGRDRALIGIKLLLIGALLLARDQIATEALYWLVGGYCIVFVLNIKTAIKQREIYKGWHP